MKDEVKVSTAGYEAFIMANQKKVATAIASVGGKLLDFEWCGDEGSGGYVVVSGLDPVEAEDLVINAVNAIYYDINDPYYTDGLAEELEEELLG